jgi:hypothetical protein
MTFDQCHDNLTAIRRKQGTTSPLIRVDYGGTAYQGRLARTDSDPDRRRSSSSPYGVLVLEALGLSHGPETILQIGSIPEDGIAEIHEG